MKFFLLCFVPFFIAVDAIGVLPIYLGLTDGLSSTHKKKIIIQSLITASIVAVAFVLGGPLLLELVGVGVSDFMVAGGILLLVISLSDLLTGEKRQRIIDAETIGAVPIGVPLITGPAVLTTSVLFANEYGIIPTTLALLANILIVGVVFFMGSPIERLLGQAGSKTVSKVASLFLASIAVMLIRRGIFEIIEKNLK
jgi:multiple antibiotic resistance protein